MRITKLHTNPHKYSSNSYLIRGDYNAISDFNTLIDTGGDDYILKEIESIYTGVGKKRVERIILTHSHFDHTGGLIHLIKKYNPEIFTFHKEEFTTTLLHDNDLIQLGDRDFIVIHTPFHSNDSVCLYNYEDKILFSGDTQLFINSFEGSYSAEYLEFINRLLRLGIKKIYPGHGDIISGEIEKKLMITSSGVYKSY